MTCVLYNRRTRTTVKFDISMFLKPIGIDRFIKSFRCMQEKYGLFLGISEDTVRESYLRYFPGGSFYTFLQMICIMTYGDISIISTDISFL